VDRIGQRRTVHACHLVARTTGEAAILDRLRRRLAAASAAIGVPDPLGSVEAERLVARLIVVGDADDAGPARREAYPSSRPVDAGAEAEARRIAVLRHAGAVSGIRLRQDEMPILVARRSGTRRALARDALLLWRVVAQNAAGAIVAERCAAVRVRGCAPRTCSRDQFGSFIDRLAAAVQPRIADATAHWREDAARSDDGFRSLRLRRERRMAAHAGSMRQAAYQTGLFDRRATRARAHANAIESSEAAESNDRIARFAQPIESWSIELAIVAIGR